MKIFNLPETLQRRASKIASRYFFPLVLLLFTLNNLQAKANTADLGVIVVSQPSYTTCESSENGELSAIGFNGEPPYSYAWSNGSSSVDINGLGLGIYTVTVTDAVGATATAQGEITLHPEGVWIMISNTAACDGSSNGTAYASAMLGTEPYTFEWSDGQTGPNASGLSEGFYTVTATDAFGCNNTGTIYIEESSEIDLFITSNYETCLGSADAKATVNVLNGQGPFTYLWSDGQTTDIATGLSTGIYSVTVTDALGCSATATEEVELSPEGLWIMLMASDAECGEDNGSIHVSVMTGVAPYDYAWSDNSIGNTGDPQNLSAGTYTVTVSDANGCTASEEVTVESSDGSVDISVSSTDATCDEGGTATVSISSGQMPYTILWSNNSSSSTITDLVAGTYTVEVTDANGCFASASVTIDEDCDPCDADAGTLTAGAGGCLISSLGISATPDGNAVVPAGYETIYVLTSGAGLVIQGVNATPDFDVTVATTYTIHTLVYDPNTLDLSTVQIGTTTGFEINSLLIQGGGTICAALDVDGASITVDNGFDVEIEPTDVTVCMGSSVSFSTNASGSGFTYNWSATGGSFDDATSASPTYTMMMPGTYTISVEVTADNGCTASASTTVTIAPNPQVQIEPQDEVLCGGGSIEFSVTGATGNLTYSWVASGGNFSNGSISNPTWTMMMPGTYEITVLVTDENGCEATSSTTATIAEPVTNCSAMATSSYFEGVTISSIGGADGAASASATGNGTLNYLWSNGAMTADIDGLSAGTYTVTVSDANGCSCESSVTLEDPAKLGNYVWEDLNKDGLQDDNEPGIPGVKVTLNGTAANGLEVMRMMNTGADGMYMFSGLLPGSYKVTFETPQGFLPTQADAGDDTLDSDSDPIMGMSPFVDLSAGEYNPTIDAGFYTCTNVGDYVWFDENHNGIQDDNETGVEGVQVKLVRAGFDGVFCTDDDVVVTSQNTGPNGEYLFECVDPGEYVVSFMNLPADWIFTDSNVGDDATDSDADATTGKTAPFTVTKGDPDNLTLDAGIRPICDNFLDGGEIITNSELICEGSIGHPIYNVIAASGGSGPIEYLWMYSTVGGPFDPATYNPIPNSNTLDYFPGELFQTTYFVRCARRLDCSDYVESNVVVINVDECGGISNLLTGTVVNYNDVLLNWDMGEENDDYNYYVEKSYDGSRWFEIGTKKGERNDSGINKYDFMDQQTKDGINYYRLKIVGLTTGKQFTNEIALQISDKILVDVFPNPFFDYLRITPVQPLEEEAIVEIFNETGQLMYAKVFPKDSEVIEVNIDGTHDFSKMILRVRYKENGKFMTIPLLHRRIK